MNLRFHEIAEQRNRVLNPLSETRLMQLAEKIELHEATRLLDLACGRGEMLCQWSATYGIMGTGVDISEVFIESARARAHELNVWSRLNWVVGDAAEYPQPFHEFNIVSCLGATWIGGGLVCTLKIMLEALKVDNGYIIVGEPYWRQSPTPEVYHAIGTQPETFTTLGGLLARFQQVNLELVDMLISSHEEWDHYHTSRWHSVYQYLRDNPQDPEAQALYEWNAHSRRVYLQYERDYLGWGVFVLRPA